MPSTDRAIAGTGSRCLADLPKRLLGVPPGAYRGRFGRPAVYTDRQPAPVRSVPS